MKDYYIYLLTNWNNKVMYIGVTNNSERRMHEHRTRSIPRFTKTYNVTKLVYFEMCSDSTAAIAREKQLKNWSRKKKDYLVKMVNPEWKDLCGPRFKDPSTSLGMTGGL